MTILEVMFAIMITTIGLLGAISVFPVASEYARKGRLNDEVTVCAESAAHTMDARSMRRPDRWIAYIDNSPNPPAVFTGPQLVTLPRGGAWRGFQQTSYCIDPRFTAWNIPNTANYEWTYFPAFTRTAPGYADNNHPAFGGNPGVPRMQRITLANGAGSPMGRFQADYVFSFEDQLSYERPGVQKGSIARNDNALPAFQLYSPIRTAGGILPGKREEDGKLSWIATLVPKFDRWNATLEDKYVLSIVVFYSRSPSLLVDLTGASGRVNEWTATIRAADFHSSGFGGGEVTITADSAAKLQMRAGDWVMLSGHVLARDPATGDRDTVPMHKWYKVTDADEDPRPAVINGSNCFQRDVTLVGPDWDLQDVLPFSGGFPKNPVAFDDDVEVTIVPGIVAVFDRTVRLEVDGTGF